MALLRIVYMGTAELARAPLAALASESVYDVVAVVSQPDRPKGRDLKLQPPPVKIEAEHWNIPIHQPERARRPEFIEALRQMSPDLIVVAAYGQILPQALLDIPKHGCVNVHTSLLPKYRGAAPIQWAILNDDPETGVTIMKMDAGCDTGPILTQRSTPILPSDTGQTLHDRLGTIGAELLIETIPDYVAGRLAPHPQPEEGVSHARKITKEDGRIDWTRPAHAIWCRVRAFTPWPAAFTFLNMCDAKRLLKIWQCEPVEAPCRAVPGEIVAAGKSALEVGCGTGSLRITSLQLEGSRRMAVHEFLAGHPVSAGMKLG